MNTVSATCEIQKQRLLLTFLALLTLICTNSVASKECKSKVMPRRDLATTTNTGDYTFTSDNITYTCILTQKANLFGGGQDDTFVDAVQDSSFNMYVTGHTYSTIYAYSDQDIIVMKFDSDMVYTSPNGWGVVWGGALTETATGIAIDDTYSSLYVSGYTNSEGTLSSSKYDMLILKFYTSSGLLAWGKRYGGTSNDKANGLTYYGSYLYVVGESDSTGWTSTKTDMVFLKLDVSAGSQQFAKYVGGTGEDQALKVIGQSDGYMYSLAQGYSTEFTYGTIDIWLIRYGQDGTFNYMYTFGGTNPDYGADIKIYGSNVYITGHSQSGTLSSGFLDIFILSVDKDTVATNWVKYIGTSSFNEYASSMAVMTDGSIYLLGTISANGYTNGNNDILVMQLSTKGVTQFVEYLGASISETPGDILYNSDTSKASIFGMSSSVAYGNQGGIDWFIFQLDDEGRNQCSSLNINNVTSSLTFKTASVIFKKTSVSAFNTIGAPTSGTVGNVGILQAIVPTLKSFCTKFRPLAPVEGFQNTTVIENTYMTFTLPELCDDQTDDMTYTLYKANSLYSTSKLDSWMLWDGTSRTLQGLVPQSKVSEQWMMMIATDDEGYTANQTFYIFFISTPYLNKAISNYQIRTEQNFQAAISKQTFLHPNGDTLTYSITNVPSWCTFDSNDFIFKGTPSNTDVGTFTIYVAATDTQNETASTSFTINVQKNYYPVNQKQVEDQQIDLNVPFSLQLDKDTFIDPNGDSLTITTSTLPSWLKFNSTSQKFSGTPTAYNIHNITVYAKDAWSGSASMSFEIVTGIRPNTAPFIVATLEDKVAYTKELFYYKFPTYTFNDSDGDTIYYVVSQPNGDYIQNWLSYEDITHTLSGIPNENATTQYVMVVADDRRGGNCNQTFKISIDSIELAGQSYLALIIVCALLGGFIVIVVIVVCRKNLKCKRNRKTTKGGNNSDSDSFEEDDDICIEDAKPKNPFAFKKQVEATPDDQYKNERYKFYGSQVQMPSHAKTKQKMVADTVK